MFFTEHEFQVDLENLRVKLEIHAERIQHNRDFVYDNTQ